MNATTIVEILSVTDTRTYEEQGDRWVPIPGSGIENECARCRRMHEVHALVRLSDGSAVIVGTGCMAQDNAEIASKIRNAASRARRVNIARAKVARFAALVEQCNAIRAQVAALPVPPIVAAPLPDWAWVKSTPESHLAWSCGDAVDCRRIDEYCTEHRMSREAAQHLPWAWKRNREDERGMTYEISGAAIALDDARRALARLERAK